MDRDADLQRAVATLRALRFFGDFAYDLLTRLVQRSTQVDLDAGELLIREGDLAVTEMYVLLDGVLVVSSQSRFILRLDRPGDVAGELAVLQAPPRTADVTAETAARVLAIRPETIALPEFADIAAVFYVMLAHSLASKLRATTTHSRRQLDEVTREAATDRLTGLANRKRLDEFLAGLEADCDSGGVRFALIMMDVDHFKHYNDSNGHPMGDIVLSRVGLILQAHTRPADLAARYGGEEFAVVLTGCTESEALPVAERIRIAIESEPVPHGDRQPLGRLTATFGVAAYSAPLGVAALLKQADECLYRGKAMGRNVVVSGTGAPAPGFAGPRTFDCTG